MIRAHVILVPRQWSAKLPYNTISKLHSPKPFSKETKAAITKSQHKPSFNLNYSMTAYHWNLVQSPEHSVNLQPTRPIAAASPLTPQFIGQKYLPTVPGRRSYKVPQPTALPSSVFHQTRLQINRRCIASLGSILEISSRGGYHSRCW